MGAGILIVVASTVAHGVTSSAGRILYQLLTRDSAPDESVVTG